jgi:hypothetical protein
MTAVWPTDLPQYVLEQGFSESEPDQLLVTAMEAGSPKTRRRYTAANPPFTLSVAMTAAQRVIFKDWFDIDLRGGSLPFTWVHPITRDAATYMFRKPVPKWSVRGNAHIVSFAVEKIASGAAYDYVAGLFPSYGLLGGWFDVSDLSSMFQESTGATPAAVNSPVGLIRDKSGNGNHLSQATSAARPLLRQDANGKYYLEGDGVDDTLTGPSIVIDDPAYLCAGVAATSDGASASHFGTFGCYSAATNRLFLTQRRQAGNHIMAFAARFNSGTTVNPTHTNNLLTTGVPFVLDGALTAVSAVTRGTGLDGRESTCSVLGNVGGPGLAAPLGIFNEPASGFVRSFYGGMIAVGVTLSRDEQRLIQEQIAALIGLTL